MKISLHTKNFVNPMTICTVMSHRKLLSCSSLFMFLCLMATSYLYICYNMFLQNDPSLRFTCMAAHAYFGLSQWVICICVVMHKAQAIHALSYCDSLAD